MQIGARRAQNVYAMRTYSNWASILHTTVAGWVGRTLLNYCRARTKNLAPPHASRSTVGTMYMQQTVLAHSFSLPLAPTNTGPPPTGSPRTSTRRPSSPAPPSTSSLDGSSSSSARTCRRPARSRHAGPPTPSSGPRRIRRERERWCWTSLLSSRFFFFC